MPALLTSLVAVWLAVATALVMLIVIATAVRQVRGRVAMTRMTAAAQRHANSGARWRS